MPDFWEKLPVLLIFLSEVFAEIKTKFYVSKLLQGLWTVLFKHDLNKVQALLIANEISIEFCLEQFKFAFAEYFKDRFIVE